MVSVPVPMRLTAVGDRDGVVTRIVKRCVVGDIERRYHPSATGNFDIAIVSALTNGRISDLDRIHSAREAGTSDGYFPSHYCGRGAHG